VDRIDVALGHASLRQHLVKVAADRRCQFGGDDAAALSQGYGYRTGETAQRSPLSA
jgi:hypothetical protein